MPREDIMPILNFMDETLDLRPESMELESTRMMFIHTILILFASYNDHEDEADLPEKCKANADIISKGTNVPTREVILVIDNLGNFDPIRTRVKNFDFATDRDFTELAVIMLWGVFEFKLSDLHPSARKYAIIFAKPSEFDRFDNVLNTYIVSELLKKYSLDQLRVFSLYCQPSGYRIISRCGLSRDFDFITETTNAYTGEKSVEIGGIPYIDIPRGSLKRVLTMILHDLLHANDVTIIKGLIIDLCSIHVEDSPVFDEHWFLFPMLEGFFEYLGFNISIFHEILRMTSHGHGHFTSVIANLDTFLKLLYMIHLEETHKPACSNALGLYITEDNKLYKLESVGNKTLQNIRIIEVLEILFVRLYPTDELHAKRLEISIAVYPFIDAIHQFSNRPVHLAFPSRSIYVNNGSDPQVPTYSMLRLFPDEVLNLDQSWSNETSPTESSSTDRGLTIVQTSTSGETIYK